MLAYHVTQDWTEGEDLLAFSSMNEWNDETIEKLMKRAADMWHEVWTVEKAREYYDNRGRQIHLHETEDEARAFREEHGGCLLEVILDGLDIKQNSENLYIENRIAATHLRRIA